MVKFLTLFSRCENVHLTKDVGIIPYLLHKDYHFDATIGSYHNGDYPYLQDEVAGLKQDFIKRIFNHSMIDGLIYLLLNYRKYDVLQAYHFSIETVITLSFFKLLKTFSKNGVTYLKLDADDTIKGFTFKGLKGNVLRFLLQKIDIISVETNGLYEYLNENHTLGRKVHYIPNGFYPYLGGQIKFENKENTILTVGRIGSAQKDTMTLLTAFTQFSVLHPNWNLEIVGPIESEFRSNIENYFAENQHLRERVFFTGAIVDKRLLKIKYDRAKIFVMTSRFESFGLVYLEAMNSGCTLVSTSITPAYDVTDNGKYGKLFPIGDSTALSFLLADLVKDKDYLKTNTGKIQKFVYDKFYWSKICGTINELITPLIK